MEDFYKMATETLSFNTAGGETTAYVAVPDASNGKAVIVIQEWWGLNEHIKDIARRYAAEGFTAISRLTFIAESWRRIRRKPEK
jgi:dienelactone hydrolase